MADAGGEAPVARLTGGDERSASASSSASAGAAPARLDGGAFLLQLLQKPPPAQPSFPHEASRHGQGHHHDPAVAALGPSHPFLAHDLTRPPQPPPPGGLSPDPLLFPFSVPPGFPPGLWPPPSSLGFPHPLIGADPGNHPFFRMDDHRFGLSTGGGVGQLPAAPLKGDPGRIPGYPYPDRAPAKSSGARGQEERSSLRAPPGFHKLPGDGAAAELDWRSARQNFSDGGSKQWKAQAERPRVPFEQNHFQADRGRSAAFQRSGMAGEQGRPSGPAQRPPATGQWIATSQRRHGNQSLGRGKWSQAEENHQPHPFPEDALKRELSGDLQQRHGAVLNKLELRSRPFSSDLHVVHDRNFVGKIDAGASEGDSDHEAVDEANISGEQKLENNDRRDTRREEDVLSEELMESLTLEVDTVQKNLTISTSRGKDFRSDSSRGHHVSGQRMRIQRRGMACRRDIDAFTPSFLSIFDSLVPQEEEKAKQRQLLLSLGKLINKEWPNAQLYLYGSCASSFAVSNSDIDVCLAIDDQEMSKLDILLKLADILQSGDLQNVQALTRARVPIVKLMDPVTGLSCDICINNLLAVVNTKLLKDYAQIDERLRQLAFIVKHWARSRRVNETYQGTLSSYAYVLMCIHFLQLRRPAILPCLQAMEATYIRTVDNTHCAYFDRVENLHGFSAQNKESIARLLWAFFHYWAYHHDYTNDVISVRTGSFLSKRAKDWTRRIGNDRHLICIEDPFEVSHDLGRVVDKYSIKILREEFERAANILQYDPNPTVTLFEPYIPASLQS